MKFRQFSTVIVMACAMLFTSSAFAASSAHKGFVTFGDTVQVNGKQLPAGEYKVTWDGEGPAVSLHILRGDKQVAESPATLKPLDGKASESAAETKSVSSGVRELTAIRFSGKNYELQLGSTASQAEMKGGDAVK
jgi:hypothetical protein